MSYPKTKQNLNLSVLFTVIVYWSCTCTILTAQSDTRQGSDTRNGIQDPFDAAPDDPFEVPEVPTAPTGEQAAVNPNAMVFQNANVDERYAGWRQASDGFGPNRLDEIVRSHWVMADDRGTLSGTVYGIEDADLGNLELTLLRNGSTYTKTKPKDDGTFQFANVRQGTYALVGWGDNAFLAFGFNILEFNEAADDNVPTKLEVTAVPNKTTINLDWIRYFAGDVKFPVYGIYQTGEGEDDPSRLYGYAGQQQFLPEARPATSISSHQVIPASDGRLIGRVHQMTTRNGRPVDLRGTRILLLKEDDVYGAVNSDGYGVFEFPEIPAGEYSCVAVGQDGIGCIGITIAGVGSSSSNSILEDNDEEPEFTPISFAMVPSESVGWLNDKAMKTAYQRIISTPLPYFDQDQRPRSCGQGGGNVCNRNRPVRPGGYRPPPKDSIPKEQRFVPRFNRAIDRFFNRDNGQIPNSTGYGGGNNGGYNNGNFSGGLNYSGPVSSTPSAGTAPPAPTMSGSTTRNQVPGTGSRR